MQKLTPRQFIGVSLDTISTAALTEEYWSSVSFQGKQWSVQEINPARKYRTLTRVSEDDIFQAKRKSDKSEVFMKMLKVGSISSSDLQKFKDQLSDILSEETN